eukprot:PhM_4_TR17010/c0_g1_i1/m.96783
MIPVLPSSCEDAVAPFKAGSSSLQSSVDDTFDMMHDGTTSRSSSITQYNTSISGNISNSNNNNNTNSAPTVSLSHSTSSTSQRNNNNNNSNSKKKESNNVNTTTITTSRSGGVVSPVDLTISFYDLELLKHIVSDFSDSSLQSEVIRSVETLGEYLGYLSNDVVGVGVGVETLISHLVERSI